MTIREQIINNIGTNILFKLDDVDFVQKDVLKSLIYRWSKTGDILKYRNGIYYFSSTHKIGTKTIRDESFNFYKFVEDTYVYDRQHKKTIGFYADNDFLNLYELDVQMSLVHTIYTNNLHKNKLILIYGKETFIIKKCKFKIDDKNVKYLSFLYALKTNDILKINHKGYDDGNWSNVQALKEYLEELDENVFFNYGKNFNYETRVRLNEIYEAIR